MRKVFIVLFTLIAIQVLCISPAYAYDKTVYAEEDVKVINQIIENNGLNENIDSPDEWSRDYNAGTGFILWLGSPGRVANLNISDRGLTGEVDVSALTSLSDLKINNNDISGLNVSGLEGTTVQNLGLYLDCGNNPKLNENNVDVTDTILGFFKIYNTSFTRFDATLYPYLKTLECYDSKITSLKVAGHQYLDYLLCYNNNLTELDITDIPNLKTINCGNNKITSLDFSNKPKIEKVNVDNNLLTSIDVSNNITIENLNINNNSIEALDVSGLTRLRYLNVDENPITELNISGLDELYELYCAKTKITKLDVDNLKNLTYLTLSENSSLASLSVKDCNSLSDLRASDCDLTEVVLQGLPALRNIQLDKNKLTSINMSGLTNLETLSCNNNSNLTEIDLSGAPSLRDLFMESCKVSSIDISMLPNLSYIQCINNPVTYLKVADDKSYKIINTQEESVILDLFDLSSLKVTIRYGLKENLDCWTFNSGQTSKDNPLTFTIDSNIELSIGAKITVEPSDKKPSAVDIKFNLTDSPKNYQYCILNPESRLILKNLTKTELTGVTVKPEAKVMLFAYRDPTKLVYSIDIPKTQISAAKAPTAKVKSTATGVASTTNLVFSKPYPEYEYQVAASVDANANWADCPDTEDSLIVKGVSAAVGDLAFIRIQETPEKLASLATKGVKTLVSPEQPNVNVNYLAPSRPKEGFNIENLEIVLLDGGSVKTLQYAVEKDDATVDELISKTTKWKSVSRNVIPNVNVPQGYTVYVRTKGTANVGFSEAYKK